jgi:hypothetical protein
LGVVEFGVGRPALYPYYAGHDELVGAVTADFFRELAAAMERARDAYAGAPIDDGMLAVCRAMRAWSIAHQREPSDLNDR